MSSIYNKELAAWQKANEIKQMLFKRKVDIVFCDYIDTDSRYYVGCVFSDPQGHKYEGTEMVAAKRVSISEDKKEKARMSALNEAYDGYMASIAKGINKTRESLYDLGKVYQAIKSAQHSMGEQSTNSYVNNEGVKLDLYTDKKNILAFKISNSDKQVLYQENLSNEQLKNENIREYIALKYQSECMGNHRDLKRETPIKENNTIDDIINEYSQYKYENNYQKIDKFIDEQSYQR